MQTDFENQIDLNRLLYASAPTGLSATFGKLAERPIEKGASNLLSARFKKHNPTNNLA